MVRRKKIQVMDLGQCPECELVMDWDSEGDAGKQYECQSCGEQFSYEDNGSNTCPSCNKWAMVTTYHSCHDCGSTEPLENVAMDDYKLCEHCGYYSNIGSSACDNSNCEQSFEDEEEEEEDQEFCGKAKYHKGDHGPGMATKSCGEAYASTTSI